MKPVVLCIMDGCAIRDNAHGNAFMKAKKPNLDMLMNKYPHSLLEASGEDVGLPAGQMGNSEVGHMNIGAGRVVDQPLQMITKSIRDGSFYSNKEFLNVFSHVKENKSKLHIFGLLSDGGIHSHIDHLMALIDLCKKENVTNVYFHMFLDGRDTLPACALKYLDELQEKINEVGFGSIATISGRYYAMDRDNNWDRIKLAYDAIALGKGEKYSSYKEAIESNYSKDIQDEFIVPAVLDNEGIVQENDGMILFNFRPDRVRELFKVFTNKSFDSFKRKFITNLKLVTMMPISDEVVFTHAFDHVDLKNILGPYLSNQGLKQLRIAETEKYAHVTYFFDGGEELELEGCSRILIPSPKVATYDLKPEMSANEITDALLKELDKDNHDVVILNFANGDMVGHTGDMKATVKAVETVDKCIGKIYKKLQEKEGTLIVTADHGNSDYMLDDSNNVITSHSVYPVPFLITNNEYTLKNGKLADIAPTILTLLGIPVPEEMTGDVLLISRKDRKVIFLQRLFLILSLICIFTFIVTYFCVRDNDNNKNNEIVEESETFVNALTSDVVTTGEGLYKVENSHIYKGENVSNYIVYDNYLWRIIKIDSNGSLYLVLDDIATVLAYGNSSDYETSYIKMWLNKTLDDHSGIFQNTMNTSSLKSVSWCLDGDKCKLKSSSLFYGLLNIDDYNNSIVDEKSYLNIGSSFWTSTKNSISDLTCIDSDGKVSTCKSTSIHGVRPVIAINIGNNEVLGEGTKENPYSYSKNSNIHVGSYISYSDRLWKVISINNNSYQLILKDSLTVNNNNLFIFSDSYNKFVPSEEGGLAYYLNHDFYNTLNNKYIIESTWYTGEYNSSSDFDYTNVYSDSILANVGLLNIGSMYSNNTYTITPSTEGNVYIVKNGSLESISIKESYEVKPSIYIKNTVSFESGDGSLNSPYLVKIDK